MTLELSSSDVPRVLDRGQIGGSSWPLQHVDTLYSTLGYNSGMGACMGMLFMNESTTGRITRRTYRSAIRTGGIQALTWPPPNQHTAITGTKAEPTFTGNHNGPPLHPPMSSRLTPLKSQTAMVWGAAGLACSPRDYGWGSNVCVCNASYCDIITPSMEKNLPFNKYLRYSSSKHGLRLLKSLGFFVPQLKKNTTNDMAFFEVDHNTQYQKVLGFGGAVTDAAALNIMSLSEKTRNFLLRSYFGREGARYSLLRVPMAGTDFSTRFYTYDDLANDTKLTYFSLAEEDHQYKIPVIKRARSISYQTLLLQACPWTAPEWMKFSNGKDGFNRLNPIYYQSWAEYYVKFLKNYYKSGIYFWSVSMQNEPSIGYLMSFGNYTMGWSPQEQYQWLTRNLGPTLAKRGFGKLRILAMEDNRVLLPFWPNQTLVDEVAKDYISGFAIHWYTRAVSDPQQLDLTHDLFPGMFLLYTEAAFGPFLGLTHPSPNLGSWERAEAYSSHIIQVLNHWATGWMDYNLALNLQGGPNWSGNVVDASVIVNATADEFYKQPMFYAIAHFSRFVPRGSRRIRLITLDNKGVENVAFVTPSGTIVTILLNRYDSHNKEECVYRGTLFPVVRMGRVCFMLKNSTGSSLISSRQIAAQCWLPYGIIHMSTK
ncbi:lysosomal acid glucosylceramidase-like [Anabrus simplex]|uniref:lysosomal acid glucosylceramidase-like n=1 Tax=Anabrus simplex TaxID=316456 RepID=UPI0035A36E5C